MAIFWTVLKSFIIAFSVVYIVDISGAMQKLNKVVFRCLYGEKMAYNGWYIPLFGCSTCSTFWAVLAYTLFCSAMDFVFCLGMACFFGYIANILCDILRAINRRLSDIFTIH